MEKLTFYPKQRERSSAAGEYYPGGTIVGFRAYAPSFTMEYENEFARRLVAAFNATRDVPVETLEQEPLTLDGVEETFERLKAQNAQLLDALEGLYYLVESQWLVRNTENDHEQNFTMRQIEPLRKLKKAQETIAATTSTEKTETQ